MREDLAPITISEVAMGPNDLPLGGVQSQGKVIMRLSPPEQCHKSPRCESANTKFCYYNSFSLSQPRYFCKVCRRYWTKEAPSGFRNVPVGDFQEEIQLMVSPFPDFNEETTRTILKGTSYPVNGSRVSGKCSWEEAEMPMQLQWQIDGEDLTLESVGINAGMSLVP
ncbi:hypothetical protein ZIOFF_000252 [Zingiber officinale]|uniref:Dof zinc finger protein n=1 Tax=Zingiber officinale TaxID=94328 RepID=A0A8J5HX90_ZINOF|nr:hypothetical protein ZIOFF_000252 [Zingiber officinale]